MKRVTIREAVGQSALQVQEGGNRITGVKVLGFDSQNRRRYTLESARQGLHLYEGTPVNIDHPSDNPNATRAIRDRFGWLENCSVAEDGIRGDLVYNPAHPLAEAVKWWASNRPNKLGLSHNAVGQGETRGGVFVVEKIVDVRGVDLVTDPASTRGLFEGRCMTKPLTEADGQGNGALAGGETANLDGGAADTAGVGDDMGGAGDWKEHLLDGIKKVLADEGIDTATQLKLAQAILRVIKSGHAGNGGEESEPEPEETEEAEEEPEEDADEEDDYDEEDEKMEGKKKKPVPDTAEVKNLREELDKLRAREAVRDRTETAIRLCKKAGLPKPAITQVFLEQLGNCDDEPQMARLIEDRRRTCGIQRPRSVASGGGRTMTKEEFARAAKGGR